VLLPLGTINLRQQSWQISDRYYSISLQEMLSEFGRVSNKLTRIYIRQLVGALLHLHGEGFTHNRLNMDNVIHDGEGRVFIDWLASSEDPLSDQERLKHFYYFPPEVLLSPNFQRS
jgi:serine/threonine protein kinase